jgi:hypothetical protein
MIDRMGQSDGAAGLQTGGTRTAGWGVAPPRQPGPGLFGGWGPRL